MPPPARNGEANPGPAKLASAFGREKNPHIAQRCRVSLMPPPARNGEANPGPAKLASALFHKKPAHRAAMPGFFDAFNFLRLMNLIRRLLVA